MTAIGTSTGSDTDTGTGSALERFAAIFGADAARQVEFSFSARADTYGTGIPGAGAGFWERVRRFAAPCAFAGAWVRAVDRLLSRLQPPSFFFKVDWAHERALRITIYFRFEAPVDEAALHGALAEAAPLVWAGPPAHRLGRCLGEPAPFIIGFRTGLDGHQVAMYYRIRATRARFMAASLPALARELSLPPTLPETVAGTLDGVFGFGAPSIIGIDSARGAEPGQLKLDVAGVPVSDALHWISAHGAGSERIHALGAIARAMRIEMLSYCGAKVGAEGMLGWKLYMPARPTARIAAAPRIRFGDDQRRIAGVLW